MAIEFTQPAVNLILQTMTECGLDVANTVFDISMKDENIVIGFIADGVGISSKSISGLKIQATPDLAKRYQIIIDAAPDPAIGLTFTQKRLF